MILPNISTKAPESFSKKETQKATKKLLRQLQKLQDVLFAESKHSLLIVLQGLDASGKDGSVKGVFSGVNPMGCLVKAFKKPTEEEYRYDFLWRIHRHVPGKGMISIFNRSHYEDVLVPRVHGWIGREEWERRFRHIVNFEALLVDSGTRILKFYLHISKEEQKQRLADRLIYPQKKWKYQEADLRESALWESYMPAFEDIFENCSRPVPWHIIPADENWYRDFLISKIIVQELQSLDMKYPDLPAKPIIP